MEVWFAGERYTTEVAGVEKDDNKHMLRSIHTALIRHFSKRCERELTEGDSKRVFIPFAKRPIQLVLGWMTVGGGVNLDTPAAAYPKTERRPLEVLRDLARYLEIDSLAKFIETDIAALAQLPPRLPTASSVQKAPEAKPAPVERTCYFCGKPGLVRTMDELMSSSDHDTRHIQRACLERKALYVNESHGPTYSMRDGTPVTKPSGMYSKASIVHARKLRSSVAVPKQADSQQLNKPKPAAQQPAEASSTEPSSSRQKLTPYRGYIRAKDSQGYQYELNFRNVEMEIDWPATGGYCKVTGTAMLDSWK